MKNLNYRLLLSLLIIVIIGLPACSDNEKEEGTELPLTEQNLVGTWELMHYEGWNQYGDERETFSEDDNTYRIQFKDDGTAQSWTYENRWIEDDYTITDWYIEDDVLYTHDSEGDDEIMTIVKLTKSTLVTESYSEDRTQYYKETYRRLD